MDEFKEKCMPTVQPLLTVDTLKAQVLEELDFRSDLTDAQVLDAIEHVLGVKGREQYVPLSRKKELAKGVFNAIRRLDILQELIDDDEITEIMVIGKTIFLEKGGRISKWEKSFSSIQTVEDIAQRIAGINNRILNTKYPLADARLMDGSRVHIVIPPISLEGPVITIRRFPKLSIGMEELISWDSITEEAAGFLSVLVRAGYNIFISGGTGSGKTTFLNALGAFIPQDERIIVIEDTAELQIRGIPNLVRLEARNQNLEGEGEITIRQLVKAALRMRPDRLIVGEVRGEEAIDLIQSMNTGHDGALSTGHANSTKDMLSRLETMVLMGMDIPIPAIRRQIASGIDVLVHLGRLRDKSRRVLEISEIIGVQDEIVTRTLFAFEENPGGAADKEAEECRRVSGKLVFRNSLTDTRKLKAAGLEQVLLRN